MSVLGGEKKIAGFFRVALAARHATRGLINMHIVKDAYLNRFSKYHLVSDCPTVCSNFAHDFWTFESFLLVWK